MPGTWYLIIFSQHSKCWRWQKRMRSGCVGHKYKNHIASQKLAPAAFSRGTTHLLTVESQGCVLRYIRTTLNSPRRPPKTASLAALLSSCSGHASLPQKLSQGGKTKSVEEKEKKKESVQRLRYTNTSLQSHWLQWANAMSWGWLYFQIIAESNSYSSLDISPGWNKGLVVWQQALDKGKLKQIPDLPQASCLVQSRQSGCFRLISHMWYRSYTGKGSDTGQEWWKYMREMLLHMLSAVNMLCDPLLGTSGWNKGKESVKLLVDWYKSGKEQL